MALTLHELKPAKGATKRSKRVGRGLSKGGSYSGRGVKGQRARSGGRAGLQLKGIRALMMKFPKSRGFQSHYPKPAVVNVGAVAERFGEGAVVTPKTIMAKGLITQSRHGVKILGMGEIGVKITFKKCIVSAAAKAKIEKAGGSVLS